MNYGQHSNKGATILFGALFIVVGLAALGSQFGFFDLSQYFPLDPSILLIATAIGSLVGGTFMIIKSFQHTY